MRTRIGDRNKRVELLEPSRTADGIGGDTTTYIPRYSKVFVAIWPISATAQIQAGQLAMTMTHRIRMIYKSDLRSDWKIKYRDKYRDRYFAIVSGINPNEADKEIELICKETEST